MNKNKILHDLHKNWVPHPGQLEVGKAFFKDRKDTVFLCCGRKWGKTEITIYILWRWALSNPKSFCLYVTPELEHGGDIVWTDGRLQTFGPESYIRRIDDQKRTIYFKNGSVIKLMGSKNHTKANGLTPSLVVYDEFCEFYKPFHDVMNPNRAAVNAPLVIIGTPPHQDSRNKEQYVQYVKECKRDPNSIFLQQPTHKNPHISDIWLDKEKTRLYENGDAHIWLGQYEAKIVRGGKYVIFSMFDPDRHVKSDIRLPEGSYDWFWAANNSENGVYSGHLLVAIEKLTKNIYIMDEYYEKDLSKVSVQQIIPVMSRKLRKIGKSVSDLVLFCDNRSEWFKSEVQKDHNLAFISASKVLKKKNEGTALIKDALTNGKVHISANCVNLIWELENYVLSRDMKLPVGSDMLIECLKYILHGVSYSLSEVKKNTEPVLPRRPGGFMTRTDPEWELDDWTDIFD